MEDRRRLERYRLSLPVSIWIEDTPPTDLLEAYTKDVSSRGTFLTMKESLAVGQRVKLAIHISIDRLHDFFDLDNRVCIEVSGVVIRLEKNGAGVRFDKKYSIIPSSASRG